MQGKAKDRTWSSSDSSPGASGTSSTSSAALPVLREALSRTLQARGVDALEIRESTLGGAAATAYRFSPESGTSVLIRLGAVGSQVVQLSVIARDSVEPLDAARFFESWRPEAEAGEG